MALEVWMVCLIGDRLLFANPPWEYNVRIIVYCRTKVGKGPQILDEKQKSEEQ